MKIEVTGS